MALQLQAKVVGGKERQIQSNESTVLNTGDEFMYVKEVLERKSKSRDVENLASIMTNNQHSCPKPLYFL